MTGFSEAISERIAATKQAADDRNRQSFVPDPELERQAKRMEEWAARDPKSYADANLGDLRTRVQTYERRKAEHEEKSK